MNDEIMVVNCPTCGRKVMWRPQSKYRPFCSERCRLMDLGAWADGEYSVAAVEEEPLADEFKIN